jgi:hypothetical protein
MALNPHRAVGAAPLWGSQSWRHGLFIVLAGQTKLGAEFAPSGRLVQAWWHNDSCCESCGTTLLVVNREVLFRWSATTALGGHKIKVRASESGSFSGRGGRH